MAQNVVVPPFDVAPETVVGPTPQSVFPFDFPFWASSDLVVYVDGQRLTNGDYTVEGLPLQDGEAVDGGYGSGVVTLNTPVSNCIVTIDRFVAGSRESQFSRAAPLGMPALNSDLNKLTARQQDLSRVLDRVPKTAVGEEPPTWEEVLTAAGLVGSAVGALPVVVSGGDTALPLNDILSLRPGNLGAIDGVLTDEAGVANIAAFSKAATHGLKLDGGRRLFAISGRLNIATPGQVVDFENISFEQIATTGTDRDQTIVIEGLDNVRIKNVTIDLAAIEASAGVGFGNAYGLHIKNCTNVYLENVRVINGCGHTGLLIEGCENVEALRCEVRDFIAYSATTPADDMCQGISVLNCTDVDLQLCGAVNLTANWPGRPAGHWRRYSRGVVLSGVVYFRLVAPYAERVDQGIDITGQDSNTGLVSDFVTWECSTYGFKIANRGNHIRVLGGQVFRSGWIGFVVSSQVSGPVTAQSRNIDIANVSVTDTGWNGVYSASDSRNSFAVVSTGFAGTEGYPAGVEFLDCASYDLQAVRTVDVHYAVRGNVATLAPNSTIPRNKRRRCRHYAAAGGGTVQVGFGAAFVKAKGSVLQDLAHGGETVLVWDTDINDRSNRNDTSNGRIYFDEDGVHTVTAVVEMAANATGRRELVLAYNGTVIQESRVRMLGDATGTNPRLLLAFDVLGVANEYVDVRAYQNTGGILKADMAKSFVSVTKVADA